MFTYKYYPYSPKSNLISMLCTLVALVGLFGAIYCFYGAFGKDQKVYWLILPAVVSLALVVAAIYYDKKILPPKAAEDSEKNISTKGSFAAQYCRAHPEAYDRLMETNPDFAANYTKNEKGRIVKKK